MKDKNKAFDESKIKELELIKSKQQYVDLVTKIPVGVYLLHSKPNGSFEFEYVSPKMEEIIETNAQSIIDDPSIAFQNFHPDDLPYMIKAIEEGIANQKPVRNIGRLLINDNIKWIEISSIPEIQPDGDILWHGFMNDITKHKLAEINIQANEQKLKTIIETSPDVITITDLEGRILMVSPAAKILFGLLDLEFAIGKMVYDFLAPQNKDLIALNIESFFKGENVNPIEYVALRVDGSEFNIEVNAEFIRDENGNPTSILLIIRDISKRIKATNDWLEVHQKLEVLMDAIPDLLFEVGIDGTIFNYHTHSSDLLAALPEVFLGKTFSEILPTAVAAICQSAIIEANVKGISTGKQYSLQLPQGEVWFDISVAPVKNIDDQISRYVFLARDVTEQKKSVFELVKLNRIQSLNSQMNDLIIRIHDKMKLFEEVCQIAATYGNFRMSWISEIDEQTKAVTPLVWYGHEEGYLKDIQKISLEKNLFGNGPTGIALREGKVSVCNNIANDPKMEPWREAALKRGYFSSIALPIIVRKKVIGTFNLYAGEVDFFALNEEVELLENITANIAFSLEKILDEEERLIAEQKVREKDIEFRKLSANVSDLIYQFTRRPDGTYFVPIASDGIINIFGCKPEDVLNDFTPISNVIYPEDFERVTNEIENSAKNLSFFTCEFRVQIPGKPIQWIYSKSNPEKLADGSVTWYGFNTDITERKQAEEDLEESHEKFKGLSDASFDSIFFSEKGICIQQNLTAELVFGYTNSEAIGKYGTDWIVPEDRKMVMDNMLAGIETPYEAKALRKDGTTFPCMLRGRMIHYKNREVRVTSLTDITEQKLAEIELLKAKEKAETSENKLKVMVNSMPDLVWFKNKEGIYLECNQRFEDFIGFSQEKLIGKTDHDLFNKEFADFFRNNDQAAMNAGKSTVNEEEITFANDGHKEFLETIKTPIYDSNNGIIGVLGIGRNITKRKIAEQKNIESLKLIEGIINTINIRVFWKDKNLKYLGCNKFFALDAGFKDPKELIGKDDYQMGWKDQAELYRTDDLSVIESGDAKLNIEETQTTPDGKIITLLTNKIPIKNSNNETYGILGTYIDISERKKIEVDLLKSKIHLQTILESTNDGILAISAHNTLLYYNARFVELWKVPQELIDTNNDQILIEFAIKQLIDPQIFLQKVNELYNSNNDSFDILDFKDGRVFERLSRPMHLNGDLHGRVWSFRDITEKRKAELEKEKNISIIRRLSVAIEQSPVTTVITDLDGNIVFVNPKFTETTGYTFEESKGQNPRILNTGHTSKSKYTDLWQTILAGNNWHGEFKNKKKNGEFFWERATISPVKNEAGEITNFLAVKEDITLQKIVDEAFQKNVRELEDYKYAIDESAIVSITDHDGIITYANHNFSKICKYSNEELVGSNHRIVNSGYHPKEYFTNMWSSITNGKVWVGELRNKAKDGSIYWVHGTIIPFLDENNKPFQYLSIRFDISKRKKAEEGILESNERYNLVAKATNDSIWDLNILTQEIVRSGNGFEVLFGYKITEDNIDCPHFRNLIHPDDLERVIASKIKVFSNPNEYNWEQDYRFLKACGEYAFVHDKGFIIRDKNGKAIRMIGATQDVTEREQHIKAIEEQNSKLRDIAWLQSHVVRAPLSRMMGIVGLLKEVELNKEEFKTWVEHFVNSSAELDKVIHDISNKTDAIELDFSSVK